jgi:hypothetical protein
MHAVYLLELDEPDDGADLHALQLRLQARLPALLTAAGERELAILEFFEAPGPGHHKQLQALAGVLRGVPAAAPADDGHRLQGVEALRPPGTAPARRRASAASAIRASTSTVTTTMPCLYCSPA